MNTLFDAFAGSETGAIIATTLMIPKDKDHPKQAKFFANQSSKFFKDHQNDLYKSLSISKITQAIVSAMALMIFGIPIYHYIEKIYDEEEFEARKTAMKDYSKVIKTTMRKVERDGNEVFTDNLFYQHLGSEDKSRLERIRLRAGVLIQSNTGKVREWNKIYIDLNEAVKKSDDVTHRTERIDKIERNIEELVEK